MKTKLISGIITLFLVLSCDSSFEELNNNPNSITTDEVIPPTLLIKGTMLADIAINQSHLQRIAGMWTGQYRGEISLYLGIYNYDISSSESNSAWTYLYNGMLKQFSEINKYYAINGTDTEGQLIKGICKVLEANAVGTATSIWGDIPYSEAVNPAISDPVFDRQSSIYNALQTKLDEAIVLLSNPTTKNTLSEDIFFGGNKDKWKKTAYTLKARYYLDTRQYALAYAAALNGISDYAGTMKFTPPSTGLTGAENLLYRFMIGTRVGYLSVNNTFCRNLLDTQTNFPTITRRNAKTNEQARRNHLNAGSITGTGTTTIINGELPVLVDFFAEWCGPCKTMKPDLEELKQKVGDKATILKIDVDKNPAIASQFAIQSIPTIIIFKNGNVVWRQMGAVPATVLEKQLQQYYA